jgi:poly(beta-D-mannuronate) lyase
VKSNLFILICCLAGTANVTAVTIRVSSLPDLQKAIAAASPGDKIGVANGTYVSRGTVRIPCAGAAREPIFIEAESVSGVQIKGTGGFVLEPPAAYVIIRGFKFSQSAGTFRVPAGVHHCRITRNVFQLAIPHGGKAAYLVVSGDDNEIDHNLFQDKATEGQMLYVQGPGTDGMARRTWIHHNYFFDFKPTANNCSALHIGHSARSLTPAHSLVEHNLFIQCRGENEGAICNKSCDNIYRYNTFGEGSTELSLRHGNRCFVYGNYFLGSAGLRFFGDDHRIFSNYFERCQPAITIGNGDANVPPGRLTSHDRPDGVQVVCNTLVNNPANVRMLPRKGGLGAADLLFANNLIIGGNRAVSIGGPLSQPKWMGNILWNNEGGAGDIPENGYTESDPKLKQDAAGIFRLTPGSTAIGNARDTFGYISADIDGQERWSKLSVGADQLSDQPTANHVLTPKDVGPEAPE